MKLLTLTILSLILTACGQAPSTITNQANLKSAAQLMQTTTCNGSIYDSTQGVQNTIAYQQQTFSDGTKNTTCSFTFSDANFKNVTCDDDTQRQINYQYYQVINHIGLWYSSPYVFNAYQCSTVNN